MIFIDLCYLFGQNITFELCFVRTNFLMHLLEQVVMNQAITKLTLEVVGPDFSISYLNS